MPRRLIVVGQLPLTPNGKLDLAALQLPQETREEAAEDASPAYASETELQLARLWAELMGPGIYRPEDSFFEAGGHSLLAVKLIALVRTTFNTTITLRNVFEAPTLRDLANIIEIVARETPPSVQKAPSIIRRARLTTVDSGESGNG